MIFILGLPLLILLMPADFAGIAGSIAWYAVICVLFTLWKKDIKITKSILLPKGSRTQYIISSAMSIVLSYGFFARWAPSSKMQRVAELIHLNPYILLTLISVVLCIAAIYSLIVLFNIDCNLTDREDINAWLLQPFKGIRKSVIFVTVLTLLFWLAQSRLPLWGNTDNYWISNVLNGNYSSDNYCYFVNPLLADLVKMIDSILPNADGLTLLGETLGLAGIWCVLYILAKLISKKTILVIYIFLIAMNFELNLLHMPFTSFTGLLTFFGIFLCYAVLHKKANIVFSVIGVIFLVFALMWRFNAFLLFMPFIALMIVTDIIVLGKQEWKSYLKRLVCLALPILLLCGVVVGIKNVNDSSSLYSAGIAYNSARAILVDYPQKDWEEIEDQLLEQGISENDYNMVCSLILADTDVVDTEYMEHIADVSQQSSAEKFKDFIKDGVFQELQTIASSRVILAQIILIIFLLGMFFCSDLNIYRRKLELTLCLLGAILIICYFTYAGHCPAYVIQTILLGVWCVFSSVLLEKKMESKKVNIIVVILLANMFFYTPAGYSSNLFASFTAKTSQITDIVELDKSDDTVYIWGVYNFDGIISKSAFFYEHKLLSKEFTYHNLVDGEWQYGQPYYIDYLNTIGINNPMQSLLYRDHTYYVANEERCQMVLTFLQEHYDENVVVNYIGEVEEVPVWQFTIEGE